MQIISLYAELMSNPRSVATYRSLVSHYKNCNQTNEALAIEELMKEMFDDNSTSTDEEQLKNNQKIS